MKVFVVNITINNNFMTFGVYKTKESMFKDFKYDSNIEEFKKIINDWEKISFTGPVIYKPKDKIIVVVDYKLVK